jgi:hypothetical protein
MDDRAGREKHRAAAPDREALLMGLFQRSSEGVYAGAAGAPDSSADADQVARARDHFSALPVPERAAEILAMIGPAIEQADDYMGMRQLLAPWLPDADWMKWSPQQRATWFSLELDLQEAFQALELARMLIRRESPYKGATDITYVLGPDGRAALSRGDVAQVVARRLPE